MANNRRLWLHVGLPKTATTALQAWMREHADDLAACGIIYPHLFGAVNNKHDFLVSALRYEPNLTELEKLLEEAKASTLVLSDEGLSNHLDDFDDGALNRFRALTQEWQVGIILVAREAAAWTRSYHKQCVLNPNNGASPLWGTAMTVSEISTQPRVSRLVDTQRLALDLQTAFGAARVRTVQFEDSAWFDSCLRILGAGSLAPAELPAANRSLPDWAIEVVRRVNHLTDEPSVRNRWKDAVQSHLRTDNEILKNLPESNRSAIDDETYAAVERSLETFLPEHKASVTTFLRILQHI